MAAWRISGAGGRHLDYSRTGIVRADIATRILLDGRRGQPVTAAATGPTYVPDGPDDPYGLYLHGLAVIPGPIKVSGTPPESPVMVKKSRPREGVVE